MNSSKRTLSLTTEQLAKVIALQISGILQQVAGVGLTTNQMIEIKKQIQATLEDGRCFDTIAGYDKIVSKQLLN